MKQEIKHTPLPWNLKNHHDQNVIYGLENNQCTMEFCVAVVNCDDRTNSENKANAEFIVRACNAHYQLLEALKALCGMQVKGHDLIDRLQFSQEGRIVLDKIEAAIAKAEGK